MPYTTQIYKEPFWAKSGDFIRGRDPLGIQNSSIATYSRLLPGITNLTLRIRYYGFYLWLLQEYHHLPNSNQFKKNHRGQYNFIRRAELALAFVMVNLFDDIQSVVGSNFAWKYKEQKDALYYDLGKGADKSPDTPKGSVYWDYSSGAMGQYYLGALVTFELVVTNENYFIKTEKGSELASAFKKSISIESRELFIQCIQEGKLYPNQLTRLKEFAIHQIPLDSKERLFYQKLMLEDDGEYFRTSEFTIPKQRVETIKHFLQDSNSLDENDEWLEFPLRIYNSKGFIGQENQTEASVGWYYYYLNELVHYVLEVIFWALLKEMEGHEYPVDYFVVTIAQQLNDKIKEIDKNADLDLTVGELLSTITEKSVSVADYIVFLNDFVKKVDTKYAIIVAVQFLIELYKDNSENLNLLEDYAIAHSVNDKHGNVIEVFNQFLLTNINKKYPDFIQACLLRIMNDHVAIAFHKMGNGERNLLKFLIENNRLLHVDTMEPRFTSPRLKALRNILIDLHFLNNDGELTETGINLLTRLN